VTVTAARAAPRGLDAHLVGVAHIYPRREGGSVVAVRSADLHAAAGETVALLGPSGSGKSTVLSILAGLVRPTSGTVLLGKRDITRMSEAERDALRSAEIGVVLQNPARNLLPYATAAQNVRFAQRGARRRGCVPPYSAGELLETLGISDLANRPAGTLSGGQQQRVAMATGLASSPGLLLVDEPTSHLDRASRQVAVETLLTANDDLGTTVVVVTHDAWVASMLSRTVTIRAGQTGLEGRNGREFAVVGPAGTVQLPGAILDAYPPGTLLEITQEPTGVRLHSPSDPTGGRPAPAGERGPRGTRPVNAPPAGSARDDAARHEPGERRWS
jgi:putative ABC transport system ATP-binding protein